MTPHGVGREGWSYKVATLPNGAPEFELDCIRTSVICTISVLLLLGNIFHRSAIFYVTLEIIMRFETASILSFQNFDVSFLKTVTYGLHQITVWNTILSSADGRHISTLALSVCQLTREVLTYLRFGSLIIKHGQNVYFRTDKLLVAQVVKFLIFYGTGRFITVPTTFQNPAAAPCLEPDESISFSSPCAS